MLIQAKNISRHITNVTLVARILYRNFALQQSRLQK